METINKKVRSMLILSIALSVGFVCGIPSIVFGATGGMVWLLVIGIVLTAVGFYGMPISWLAYGSSISMRNIVRTIVEDRITNIEELANIYNTPVNAMRNNVSKIISKGYIKGYTLKGDNITKAKVSAPSISKCPNCGSPLVIKGNKRVCEYCSAEFEK